MNSQDKDGRPQTTTAPLIDIQIEDIWPLLQKQRQVIFLFLGIVLTATLVFGLLRTPEYRATTKIQLSPRPGQELNVSEVVDFQTRGYFEIQQFFRTQIQIILSRTVREEVVKRYGALGYDDLPIDDGGIDKLLNMVTVVPEEQSRLVSISVVHTDPEKAAILANLVADAYSDFNLEDRRDASSGALDWLNSQLEDYADKVATANKALYEFKAETTLVDVEQRLNTLDARLRSLNEVFGARSTDLVVMETELKGHEQLLRQGAWKELARVLDGPVLDATARNYAEVEATAADLAARYGPKHPERIQTEARLEGLVEVMRSDVSRVLDGERARVSVARDAVQSLATEIEAVKRDMLEYQRQSTEYMGLKAEMERVEGFYEQLSKRLEEVRLTSRTQLNNVRVVDAALPPLAPWKPNIPMSMIVALLVGVVGGAGLALLREYLDDTVSSQLDVIAHLKVPFLGFVPRLPEGVQGHEADLFSHYNPRSSVAEAVRGIRAMIEMNPDGPSPRRILVTSSVAREGKTSTALRLGISFAQMGRKVVIIDADLRRPRLHKVFGHDHDIGLSSFLVKAASADEITHPTEVPNLSALYSGARTDQPTELIASERMEELLTALEERFDIILIDTPPSVALSDAVTLSRRVDGTLFVVKEQSVSRQVVKQTLDLLGQVDARVLGVVLNNVDLSRSGSKYKYYYAYRDSYSAYADADELDPGDKAAK